MSGQSTAKPGEEIAIYSVRLANDGGSSLQAVSLTLADLSTPSGIAANAFSRLRLYRSNDDLFDASDTQIGTQTTVNLGSPTTILLNAPDTTPGFPYYIATVELNTAHTDEAGAAKDAFRLGVAAGSLSTSDGAIGSAVTADDGDRVTIDVEGTRLVVSTQPTDAGTVNGDAVSGQIFATQPVIEVQDDSGNLDVDYASLVSVALASGAGVLAGNVAVAMVDGQTQFTDLAYSATSDQESFSLTASSGSLAAATTAARTADVVAQKLVFTTQPADAGAVNGDVVSGQAFATQPTIQARDADDLKDQNFSGQIDITLGSGAGNLSGTLSTTAASGDAQFSNLVYLATSDQESFSLRASSGSLIAATTAVRTADVVAQKLVFTTQPTDAGAVNGDVVSGQAFATQPTVQARDADDLKDQNFAAQIDIALQSGAGGLSGTLSTTAASGDAQFSNLVYLATSDQESFSLRASSGSLTAATTAARTADVVAQKLVFTTQPADARAVNGNVVSGQAFATQPALQARDADDLKDQNFAAQIDIALGSGVGSLSGTLSTTAASGDAQFSNLVYSATSDQESFSLRASSGSLTAATTAAVTADVVATQLVFTTQPADAGAVNGDVVSGQAFATQPVLEAQNSSGIRDINLNAGSALIAVLPDSLVLSGTTAKVWNSGVADFAGLGLAVAVAEDQVVFNLTASGSSLTAATSAAITADVVATQIAFATEPADIGAVNGDVVSGQAFATQPALEAQDANGIRDIHVSSGTAALEVNSGAVTLSGSTSANWSSGQASFSGLAAAASDQVNFTLRATGAGFTQGVSGSLTADVVATQVVFATEPSDIGAVNGDVVSGQPFATQPVLEAQNADGIRDQDINSGSAVLGVESDAAVLAGTATENWSAGRADFSGNDLSVSGPSDGISFVLSGSSGGLVQASSSTLRSDVVATQLLLGAVP